MSEEGGRPAHDRDGELPSELDSCWPFHLQADTSVCVKVRGLAQWQRSRNIILVSVDMEAGARHWDEAEEKHFHALLNLWHLREADVDRVLSHNRAGRGACADQTVGHRAYADRMTPRSRGDMSSVAGRIARGDLRFRPTRTYAGNSLQEDGTFIPTGLPSSAVVSDHYESGPTAAEHRLNGVGPCCTSCGYRGPTLERCIWCVRCGSALGDGKNIVDQSSRALHFVSRAAKKHTKSQQEHKSTSAGVQSSAGDARIQSSFAKSETSPVHGQSPKTVPQTPSNRHEVHTHSALLCSANSPYKHPKQHTSSLGGDSNSDSFRCHGIDDHKQAPAPFELENKHLLNGRSHSEFPDQTLRPPLSVSTSHIPRAALLDLPNEILIHIFASLDKKSLISAGHACRQLNEIATSPLLCKHNRLLQNPCTISSRESSVFPIWIIH